MQNHFAGMVRGSVRRDAIAAKEAKRLAAAAAAGGDPIYGPVFMPVWQRQHKACDTNFLRQLTVNEGVKQVRQ